MKFNIVAFISMPISYPYIFRSKHNNTKNQSEYPLGTQLLLVSKSIIIAIIVDNSFSYNYKVQIICCR